jgi:hypothetical protein
MKETPVSQWRPIETDPPPLDADVLIWQPGQRRILVGRLWWNDIDDVEVVTLSGYGQTNDATHWMPLPSPPGD